MDDFAKRTKLSRAQMMKLANSDAFGSLTLDRRQSLWQSLNRCKESRPLFEDIEDEEPRISLPAMSALEQVVADYKTVHLSLKAHPVSFYRDKLTARGIVSAQALADLPNHGWVR